MVLSGSLGTFDKAVNSNNMKGAQLDFGDYLNLIRTEKGLSQKVVAEKLGIDISLLSKIEHGERKVQGHMLNGIAELFGLEYKDIQIKFLSQKMEKEFGKEPYFYEAIKSIQHSKKGNNY